MDRDIYEPDYKAGYEYLVKEHAKLEDKYAKLEEIANRIPMLVETEGNITIVGATIMKSKYFHMSNCFIDFKGTKHGWTMPMCPVAQDIEPERKGVWKKLFG